MTPSVSVIIPLYNEERRVGALIDELAPWVEHREDVELLFVNDGSSDRTAEELDARCARLPRAAAQHLEPNRGKGAALRAGMLSARGDLRIFTDADLPYGLDILERVIESLTNGSDVVVGARDHPESQAEPGVLRGLSSWGFRAWVALVASTGPVRDTQCGLKGFTAKAAELLFHGLKTDGFAFDVEIITLAALRGMTVTRIPVQQRPSQGSTVRLHREVPRMLLGTLSAARAARRRHRGLSGS